MKKVKQILPLFLAMVLFVTSVFPAYATGTDGTGAEPLAETVRYEYSWDGETQVACEGVTITDTAGNELTLETEEGTTNNYVLLTNTSGVAANIQADISGIDPSDNIVVEISLQRNGNMPPMGIRLNGTDSNEKESTALIFKELSNAVKNLNTGSTAMSGLLTGNGWKNIGLIVNTTEKTVALYMYDADSQSYVHKVDIGTYDAEFATLTNLVVGCEETTNQNGRTCGIDNIRVYNGSEFIAEVEPTKYNVTITTQETGKDDAIDTYENGATSDTDYAYTLPTATGYEYSVSAVTIGGTAYTGYTISEGKLTVPGAAVTGDIEITVTKTVVKPTNYEYNWDGETQVACEGVTITDTAGNELTLETEEGTTNNYVLLTNTSGVAANIQADISGIDPSDNIVVEISLQRNGNMPPMGIRLNGTDSNEKESTALIFKELSNAVKNLNTGSTAMSGLLTGNGWKNIGLIVNTTEKTVALYMYDADSQSYVHKVDIGTYDAEFATLTNLVVGCEETTNQNGRTCGIDNIRVYNGSEFIAEVEPTKYNVTITTQETGKDDAIDTYENGATSGTDYTYTLPTATGYEYSVSAVTIGGTAYTGYTISEGKLAIPGAAVTGDVAITLAKTATQTGEEEEVITFQTNDGSALIEAEATTYSADESIVLKQDFSDGSGSALRLREWYGSDASNNAVNSLAPSNKEPGISFNVDVDVAGKYYIWARSAYYNQNNAYIWLSLNGGSDYARKTLRHGTASKIFADLDMDRENPITFEWIKIAEIEVTDVNKDIEVRIKPIRVGGDTEAAKEGYAAAVDSFIVTANSYYSPFGKGVVKAEDLPASDEILVQTLPSDEYDMPPVAPTQGVHPRVLFTAEDIPTIKGNLAHAENEKAYSLYVSRKDKEYDGILSDEVDSSILTNHDDEGLRIIEAKAFDYVINYDKNNPDSEASKAAKENGLEAISALLNYLETYKSVEEGNNYRRAAQVLCMCAEVYDWCHDLLEPKQKEAIVGRCQYISYNYMEVGFPPSAQGTLAGHGCGTQYLRAWVSLAIATYDEYPDIYNYVVGKYFQEFVPTRNYLYESGGHYQGNAYGPGRFDNCLWAQLFICNMNSNDAYNYENPIYVDGAAQVAYQWIYSRRPDGELFRDGDDSTERSAGAAVWYEGTKDTFFLASNFYKDGVVKKAFLENADVKTNIDDLSAVQMLALNDPTIELKEEETLSLTKYISYPHGTMIARTGWNMGVNSPDVLAHMKIGELWLGNHIHRNAGSFQIYYKGILASESGAYMSYGDTHDNTYNKASVAHNTLSITSQANPTGVQRTPNNNVVYNTIDDLKADLADCTTGEVIGQEFGPDTYTPEYTYLAGDIAAAYDENVQEAVRSMLFLPMEDETHPAAFVVFDRITTAEANSKKSFLLHMQSKPTISGNVTTITNTDENYNGMLTNQTLLPANATIEAIGGKGKEFMVGDVNYEPSTRLSMENMEAGWGRVEISTITEAANQTDYFLNVMYVNDADQTLALEEAKLIETSQVVGAKIFDRVAVFNKALVDKTDRIGTEISFEIPADDKVTAYKVNVAGLQDGTWTVTTSNGTQTAVATEDGGIIYFAAPAGTCTLTRTSDANTKEFTSNKPVIESNSFDIRVNGRYLYTITEPEKNGEEIYLPVKALFGVAYSTITEDTDGSVSIEHLGVKIDVGSNGATATLADGTPITTADVKLKGNEFLVPTSFLLNALGDKMAVAWNELCQLVDVTIEEVVIPEAYDWSDTYPNAIKVQNAKQLATGGTSNIWDALDGDLGSNWGTQGRDGTETGIFDFGRVYELDDILIAFNKGNEIVWEFAVEVSTDGETYTPVLGKTQSKESLVLEAYDMNNVKARYVKLLGYGNQNGSTWNTLKEIVFLGEAVTIPEATPTPSPEATPTPSPEATPTPSPEATPTPSPEATSTPGPEVTQAPNPEAAPVIVPAKTDTSYTQGTNGKVTIYCSGEYNEFLGVDMDGKEIDESNYTVTEGSTIVEFKSAYLETLTVGEHTVTLRYTNDRSVDSKLAIVAKVNVDTDDENMEDNVDNEDDYDKDTENVNDSESGNTTTEKVVSAPTGDGSNMLLWSMLLVLASITMIAVKRFSSKKLN